MPYSMTSFARESAQYPWGQASWEIRSVNHRYLETHFRLPDTFRELEMPLRELARRHLQRGKLDCSLNLQLASEGDSVAINLPLASQYIAAAQQIAALMEKPAKISPLEILHWPGVLKEAEIDREDVKQGLLSVFTQALEQLNAGRAREGEKLKAIICQRLDAIEEIVTNVRRQMPALLDAQKQKLRNRLDELQSELNPDRVEQEMVILAQKADVDEELDRLDTHVAEIRRVLDQTGPAGRRLDFLMQELNREANTLGSKSLATSTTQAAVELKVLIEQMREQIQNIE